MGRLTFPSALLTLGLLIIFSSGCPLVPPVGHLHGRVYRVDNLQPIAGAQVTLTGTIFSGTTDGSGHYSISNIPAGTYTVSVSAPGYVLYVASVEIIANATWGLDFFLTPSS